MANVRNGNTFYCESVSTANTDILESDGVQILGIIFTSDVAGATFTLCDLSQKKDAGVEKLSASLATADDTLFLRFADLPIVFPKGIFVSALSSGSLSIIVKEKS
jgi:hypothetical protein